MKDRITIEGREGTFNAYVARPKTSPAPAVVVLQELFGVNADIRKTCDELAEQGFLNISDGSVTVKGLIKAKAMLPVSLRRDAKVNARLLTPE